MKVVGIDLAGVEARPTGFCVLDGMSASCSIRHKDREIVEVTEKIRPEVVAIDAPLALPKGRKSLEERSDVHLRACDKALLEMKIKFFPITLGPMRKLTKRGIKLKELLEDKNFEVIETYPGAAQDVLEIPRKQRGLEELRKSLAKLGIKGLRSKMTGDELDAVTCALVGKMYLDGDYMAIGDPDEILMILPERHSK